MFKNIFSKLTGGNGVNTIIVNGTRIQTNGSNITVNGNSIYVDGTMVSTNLVGTVDVKFEGNLVTLKTDGSATIYGDIKGNADIGGSLNYCNDIGGSVDAGGSVRCGNVGGDIDAGGSVTIKK